MISDSAWRGVARLLDDYIVHAPLDRLVIAYAPDVAEQAAWVSSACRSRGIECRTTPMRPLRDPGLYSRVLSQVPSDPTSWVVFLTLEGDTFSHTGTFAQLVDDVGLDRARLVRLISAGPELFEHGFRLGPESLSRRNALLLNALYGARSVRIRTAGGSDLVVSLDTKYQWISNRGRSRPGAAVVLPAGEVATYPARVDGVLIADFAMNVNFVTGVDLRLQDCPVRMEIEDSRAVDWLCRRMAIQDLLRDGFARPNAQRVGEFGLGTDAAIREPVRGNSHLNERRSGVHIGFGQHNQNGAIVDYECDVHLDLIARGGTMTLESGQSWDLDCLPEDDIDHPTDTADEDLFSPPIGDGDCCSAST